MDYEKRLTGDGTTPGARGEVRLSGGRRWRAAQVPGVGRMWLRQDVSGGAELVAAAHDDMGAGARTFARGAARCTLCRQHMMHTPDAHAGAVGVETRATARA